MRTTGWLVLVVLFGCGPKPPSLHDQAFMLATRLYMETLVMPLCSGRGSPPSTQPWTHGSMTGTQPCGLLAWGFEPDGEWREGFFARLQERYSHADAAWIRNHCVGYPGACDGPGDIEALFLRSHDDWVTARYKGYLDRLERAR